MGTQLTNHSVDSGDLLKGAAAIAEHLNLTERQARFRIEQGEIPTFRLGGTICSTKSGLAAHFAKLLNGAG